MQLTNKKVLITGGSSGLGFSMAKKLLEKGAVVYILGRHRESLDAAAKELGLPQDQTILSDVSNYPTLECSLENREVDILINNAGIFLEGTIDKYTLEEISDIIEINLIGAIYTTKIILPQMLKKNDGYILNVVSTSGLRARANQSLYITSKFGLSGFTKALQADLAETNIKVAGIYPGGMKTPIFEKGHSSRSTEHFMHPDDVADIVVFMLEKNETLTMSEVVANRKGQKS